MIRQEFVPVKGCPSFTPFTSIIVDSIHRHTQKQNRHLNEKFVLVIFIIINNNQGKKKSFNNIKCLFLCLCCSFAVSDTIALIFGLSCTRETINKQLCDVSCVFVSVQYILMWATTTTAHRVKKSRETIIK